MKVISIHINQYGADKKKIEIKWRFDKKIPDTSGLVTVNVLNTKVSWEQNTKY